MLISISVSCVGIMLIGSYASCVVIHVSCLSVSYVGICLVAMYASFVWRRVVSIYVSCV